MKKFTKRIIIFSVFAVIVLALLLYYVNLREYYQALKEFPITIAFIYLVIIFVSFFLRSFRWKELLSATGFDTSIKFSWRTMHAAWFVNWITPLRIGEMVRLYSAKKNEGISYGANSAAIAIEHIFDLIAILIIICTSLIATLQLSQVPDNTYFVLVLALVAIIGLIVAVIVLLFFGNKAARLVKPINNELYENLLYLHSS
ncbi:MAG: flippase-like domain-containing protein, partial [Candidatus Lokiarchaeota archaeon]|nr:flippase-like domain-containing protein [Candidatus Lokiarchaeota archaeon]